MQPHRNTKQARRIARNPSMSDASSPAREPRGCCSIRGYHQPGQGFSQYFPTRGISTGKRKPLELRQEVQSHPCRYRNEGKRKQQKQRERRKNNKKKPAKEAGPWHCTGQFKHIQPGAVQPGESITEQ